MTLVIERQRCYCEATENRWTDYVLKLVTDSRRVYVATGRSVQELAQRVQEWRTVLGCPEPDVETVERTFRDPF